MPMLKSITVYPIKSFDGMMVQSANVLTGGALQNDRRFALLDENQKFINAKRTAAIHRLRARFDAEMNAIWLKPADEVQEHVFSLSPPRRELQNWLSGYFEMGVTIVENVAGGLPDDTDASGPTIVSTATLETVASWYPGLTADEVRVRFRPNLEIDGVEPFWEDRLFAEAGQTVRFTIGSVQLDGVNPCQRCPVPTRNPWTGEVYPHFARVFQQRRQASLPDWAMRSRFDHFYRLTTNTRGADEKLELPPAVRVGDEVRILGVASVK